MNFQKRLSPFAQIYAEIDRKIWEMDVSELKLVIKACDKPTNSNCWWATFQCAPLIKRLAKEAIRSKQCAARKERARIRKVKECEK